MATSVKVDIGRRITFKGLLNLIFLKVYFMNILVTRGNRSGPAYGEVLRSQKVLLSATQLYRFRKIFGEHI